MDSVCPAQTAPPTPQPSCIVLGLQDPRGRHLRGGVDAPALPPVKLEVVGVLRVNTMAASVSMFVGLFVDLFRWNTPTKLTVKKRPKARCQSQKLSGDL